MEGWRQCEAGRKQILSNEKRSRSIFLYFGSKRIVSRHEIYNFELSDGNPLSADKDARPVAKRLRSGVPRLISQQSPVVVPNQCDPQFISALAHIEASAKAGLELIDVSVHRPNLESVFLHLTGRELRD
jgi:hypothetical protein